MSSWGRNVLLGLSGAILVFATLAYGAVHTWAYSIVGLVTGLMSLVLAAYGLYQLALNSENLRYWPYPPLWWFAAGLLILLFIQLIPLPAEIFRLISPSAWQIRSLGSGYALADFLPLSLNPYATRLEALKFWPALVMFFILLYTINTRKKLLGMIGLVLAIAAFEVVYGFWNYWDHSIWGWENPWGGHRLCGTFINSNHLATVLSMAILLGFGFFLAHHRFFASQPQMTDTKKPGRRVWSRSENFEPEARSFLLLALLLLLTVGLLFTGSRGGIISFTFGCIFMSLLIFTQRWKKGPILILILFILLAFSYSLFIGSGPALSRFSDDNSGVRFYYFRVSLALFQDFPYLGSGLGTLGDLFYQYEPAQLRGVKVSYTHNDWLQFLPETGLVGFFLVQVAWWSFFFSLVKKWKKRQDPFVSSLTLGGLSAIAAAWFHGLMDFPFHILAFSLLFSTVVAITYLAVHLHQENFTYPELKAARPRLVVCLLLGLMLIQIAFCLQVGYNFSAEIAAPTEVNSTRLPRTPSAKDFRRAISFNPHNSKYYLGLAKALAGQKEGKQMVQAAEDALKRAVFLAPADWGARLALAEFSLRQWESSPSQYIPLALQELSAAVCLFPESAFLNYRLAIVLGWAANYHLSLIPPDLRGRQNEYLEKALILDPGLKKFLPNQGNRSEARRLNRMGITSSP